MKTIDNLSEVRATLQKFQDGFAAREVARLHDFMQLFDPNDEIEMIGAAKRAVTEWFESHGMQAAGLIPAVEGFDYLVFSKYLFAHDIRELQAQTVANSVSFHLRYRL